MVLVNTDRFAVFWFIVVAFTSRINISPYDTYTSLTTHHNLSSSCLVIIAKAQGMHSSLFYLSSGKVDWVTLVLDLQWQIFCLKKHFVSVFVISLFLLWAEFDLNIHFKYNLCYFNFNWCIVRMRSIRYSTHQWKLEEWYAMVHWVKQEKTRQTGQTERQVSLDAGHGLSYLFLSDTSHFHSPITACLISCVIFN